MTRASGRWLIVDGHNLLFGAPAYRRLGENDLGLAISRLVADLEGLAARRTTRITTVFDGFQVGAAGHGGPVEVVFSRKRSADEVIEALARGADTGCKVTVVTADLAIIQTVSRPGVTTQRPDLFAAELLDEGGAEPSHHNRLALDERLSADVKDKLERLRRGGHKGLGD